MGATGATSAGDRASLADPDAGVPGDRRALRHPRPDPGGGRRDPRDPGRHRQVAAVSAPAPSWPARSRRIGGRPPGEGSMSDRDPREPGADDERPTDAMTGHDPWATREARGRDALRELRVEPPAGRRGRTARRASRGRAWPSGAGPAPATLPPRVRDPGRGRRRRRRRGRRRGRDERQWRQPAHESASLRAKAASPTAPTASKSYQSAAAGSAGDAAAVVRVPALIGRSLGKAGSLAGAHGLRVQLRAKPCPSSARVQVVHQQPRAGTRVAAGATIHVSTC